MATNCYKPASSATISGGSMQVKENGTRAWVSSGKSSITFTDKVQAGITVRYCFQVKFIGTGQTNWTLEWKNTTAGTSATRSGTDSPSSTARVRCVPVDQVTVNGQAGNLTNQEIKFSTSANGGAIVYKLVREWSGAPVNNTPPPGAKPAPTLEPTQSAPPVAPTPVGLCGGLNAFGIGNQGPCVSLIQQQLKNLGYNIGSSGVDGVYGQDTANAVKVYQQKAGLAQDGVVGPQTWNSMFGSNPARKQ
ncbi:peptidoglycan-binding protein [bacterium]|nr:peptidoglycan-binding protein [bacterium]